MRIGYACLTVGVPNTDIKSCIMKNATETKLKELIAINLEALDQILDYNIRHDIYLFRISSDLIPFGSSPVNTLPWWDLFCEEFQQLGHKIRENGMRVSMHPGQYTVLNSPDEAIVKRAVEDLIYHTRVLESLGTNQENKIILHIGGAYNDKEAAIKRFCSNYTKLDPAIKQRLVIENDDKIYHISEVLSIGNKLGIPVVFDNLHHSANPSSAKKSEREWIYECSKTWKKEDGPQKLHYSQQNPFKKPGSHSEDIKIDEFIEFYDQLIDLQPDIMLEVKDKNLSAVKCINYTTHNQEIARMEEEWSKYKYTILEHSPKEYLAIEDLLNRKEASPAYDFYRLVEAALEKPVEVNAAVEAAMLAWECIQDVASASDKTKFADLLVDYQTGNQNLKQIKNLLWRLTQKYQRDSLRNSYYFILT